MSNNEVATADVAALIQSMFTALGKAAAPADVEALRKEPAVPIRSSVKQDYIVCLEDGKKLKMLKRYLRTTYDMSPEDYRAKWKLPRDYPMVAPAYAEQRRGLAHSIGLGRRKATTTSDVAVDAGTHEANTTMETGQPASPAAAKPARKPRAKKAADKPAA